jgi:hypothetical protein
MPRLADKSDAGRKRSYVRPQCLTSRSQRNPLILDGQKQSNSLVVTIGMSHCAVDTAKTADRSFAGQTFLHASNAAISVLISFQIEQALQKESGTAI